MADMANAYRVYILGTDDPIRSSDVLDCAADEDALRLAAERHPAAHALEVWRASVSSAGWASPTLLSTGPKPA